MTVAIPETRTGCEALQCDVYHICADPTRSNGVIKHAMRITRKARFDRRAYRHRRQHAGRNLADGRNRVVIPDGCASWSCMSVFPATSRITSSRKSAFIPDAPGKPRGVAAVILRPRSFAECLDLGHASVAIGQLHRDRFGDPGQLEIGLRFVRDGVRVAHVARRHLEHLVRHR